MAVPGFGGMHRRRGQATGLRSGVPRRGSGSRGGGASYDGRGSCEDGEFQKGRRKGLRRVLAKRIRVYELARELGLTNKETLDLCESLGIGVKSHSSSIEDAQADRVRRKADREGLRREVQPEEPAPAKRGAKKAAASVTPGKPDDAIAAEAPEAPAARSPEHASRLVTSRPLS